MCRDTTGSVGYFTRHRSRASTSLPTDNPTWAAELKRVYNNDLDMLDTMVGMIAEPPPEGMGFSDTAFRIFLLMASRRLKSDRFLSEDYRPEITADSASTGRTDR